MLPRVLYVYWGFHSWWCSRQRGGRARRSVCECVCQGINSIHAQTARFNMYAYGPTSSSVSNPLQVGCPWGRACAKESIRSCTNCEVQHSYCPTTTAKHEFIVQRSGGPPNRLRLALCTNAAHAPQLLPGGGGLRSPKPEKIAVKLR